MSDYFIEYLLDTFYKIRYISEHEFINKLVFCINL